MKNIKATHTLSWYKDRDNIPNQILVDGIIKYFTGGPRTNFWDIEDFLNLLWGVSDHVLENRNAPDEVVERLQNLPLNEEQKHVLFGLLLKLVGGYPVANLNEEYKFVLKRIEALFLEFPGDTPEKEFCRFDIDKRARLKGLSTLYTDAANGRISESDFARLHKKIVGTESKEFENIDELINGAIETGRIDSSAVKNKTEFKIDFNKWLGENKKWDLYDENEYKKLLSISNLQEFIEKDSRIYFIKDGKQQMPVYDFIKAINPDAPINPTHNFDLLKQHRLNTYNDVEAKFIEQRNIDRVGTGDLEKNIFYHGWLRHELEIIELWLSDTHSSGEKKKRLTPASNQIEILKYKQFVDTELVRIENVVNNNPPAPATTTQPNIASSTCVTEFDYSAEKITAIHSFCNGSVFKDVSLHEFGECVAQANFSTLHCKKGTIKSKLKYIICILSHSIDDTGWYRQAAISITTTPSKCSGANILDATWKEQANALK